MKIKNERFICSENLNKGYIESIFYENRSDRIDRLSDKFRPTIDQSFNKRIYKTFLNLHVVVSCYQCVVDIKSACSSTKRESYSMPI